MSSFRHRAQWSFNSLDVHCPISQEEREDEELMLDGLTVLREAMGLLTTRHSANCRCTACVWRRDAIEWQDRCMGVEVSPPPTLTVVTGGSDQA